MKPYKLILTIAIGLLLLITVKAFIIYQKAELTKTISPKSKYEVASQGRQTEEKFWNGNY
jgi:hypothetical protein